MRTVATFNNCFVNMPKNDPVHPVVLLDPKPYYSIPLYNNFISKNICI
jgi:hypothetical protein